jgi:hypothetical protein
MAKWIGSDGNFSELRFCNGLAMMMGEELSAIGPELSAVLDGLQRT